MINYTPKDIARFWSKVKLPDMIGTDECWEWQASHNGLGYGQFSVGGRKAAIKITAPRFSYIINFMEIPEKMVICHKCDNPLCVNPSHLFMGTQKDNIQDMIKKGRRVQNNAKGESVPGHKLTEKDILVIRDLYSKEYSQDKIANIFGVHQTMISVIVRRKKWAHVR